MLKMRTPKIKYLVPLVVLGLYFPVSAFALLSSVPVNDETTGNSVGLLLETTEKFRNAFQKYVENFDRRIFDDENSSLRTLLSLNPPAGTAAELVVTSKDPGSNYAVGGKTQSKADLDTKTFCKLRQITNPNGAKPTNKGAWQQLIDDGQIDRSLPDFANVEVNDSTSLTCLMQEMVEYNKLQVNLQIHALMRDYINSALAASLSQRTSGMIAKANLDWVKRGNIITRYDEDGQPVSQESFDLSGSDPEAYKKALIESRDRTIQDRILNEDPTKPSYNICSPFKYSIARDLKMKTKNNSMSDVDAVGQATKCSLVSSGVLDNEDDYDAFLKNPSISKLSPFDAYDSLLTNKQSTSHGARIYLDLQSRKQKGKIASTIDREVQSNGGYISARQCDPEDPNCDISTSEIVTPGGLINRITGDAVTQQDRAVANADTPEKQAAAPANNFSSVSVMSGGLTNYDTNNLYPNQTIESYMGEFLNGIRGGYYDLQSGTIDWASGAMLQIYDKTMTNVNAYTNAPSTQSVPEN